MRENYGRSWMQISRFGARKKTISKSKKTVRISFLLLILFTLDCGYWNGYKKMKDDEQFGRDLIPICLIHWKRNDIKTPGKSTNGKLLYANNTIYSTSRRSDYSSYDSGYINLTSLNYILSSRDEGGTWSLNSLPDLSLFFSIENVYFSNDTFIVTWRNTKSSSNPIQISYSKDLIDWKTFASTDSDLTKAAVFDNDNIWLFTNTKIYSYNLITGNSNLLFTVPTNEQTAGEKILDVKFLSSSLGYSISNSYLKKTTDGGINWSILYTISNDTIIDFNILNTNFIWLRSTFPKIYFSQDGGTSFNGYSLGESLKSGRMAYWDSANGIIVGSDNKLYNTSDSGANWNLSSSVISSGFSDLIITSSNTGYLNSKSQLYKTDDRGLTWKKIYDQVDSYTYERVNNLMTENNFILWICLGVAKYSGHPPDK